MRKILGILVIKITGTIVDLLIPLIIGNIVNEISLLEEQFDLNKIKIMLVIMVLLAIYGVLTNIIANGLTSLCGMQ